MYPAWVVLVALLCGIAIGVGVFATAVRVGTPKEKEPELPESIPEQPRHRPIASSFGLEDPLRTPPRAQVSHPNHRPINRG